MSDAGYLSQEYGVQVGIETQGDYEGSKVECGTVK